MKSPRLQLSGSSSSPEDLCILQNLGKQVFLQKQDVQENHAGPKALTESFPVRLS